MFPSRRALDPPQRGVQRRVSRRKPRPGGSPLRHPNGDGRAVPFFFRRRWVSLGVVVVTQRWGNLQGERIRAPSVISRVGAVQKQLLSGATLLQLRCGSPEQRRWKGGRRSRWRAGAGSTAGDCFLPRGEGLARGCIPPAMHFPKSSPRGRAGSWASQSQRLTRLSRRRTCMSCLIIFGGGGGRKRLSEL